MGGLPAECVDSPRQGTGGAPGHPGRDCQRHSSIGPGFRATPPARARDARTTGPVRRWRAATPAVMRRWVRRIARSPDGGRTPNRGGHHCFGDHVAPTGPNYMADGPGLDVLYGTAQYALCGASKGRAELMGVRGRRLVRPISRRCEGEPDGRELGGGPEPRRPTTPVRWSPRPSRRAARQAVRLDRRCQAGARVDGSGAV